MQPLPRSSSAPKQKQAARPAAWPLSRRRLSLSSSALLLKPERAERHFVPARYSGQGLAWRASQRCKFVAGPCAGGTRALMRNTCAYCTLVLAVLATRRFQGIPARFPRRPWRSEFPLEFQQLESPFATAFRLVSEI